MKASKKKVAKRAPKAKGIGTFCTDQIANTKKSWEGIAESAREKFHSKTTAACVSWYANRMKKSGVKFEEERGQ